MCLDLYVASTAPLPPTDGIHLDDRVPGDVADQLGGQHVVSVSLRGGCACDLMGEGGDLTAEALVGRQALSALLADAARSGGVVLAGRFGGDSLRGVIRESATPSQVVDLDWEAGWDSPRMITITTS